MGNHTFSFSILAFRFQYDVYSLFGKHMGIRENLQKLLTRKLEEIAALELQVRETRAYVQGLQDSMKFLPRDGAGVNGVAEHVLREGSALAKTRDVLKAAGSPMTIVDILKALGKPQDKSNRVSLAGTLSGYSREGKVFARTAPNTFGLIEFRGVQSESEGDDIPENFGSMDKTP
jgi:hypothetical protein